VITAQPPAEQYRYSVIVTYDAESGTYLADVPALGLLTYGFSVEHAFEMAEEAISLRVESAVEDGEPILIEEHPASVRQVAV
jgi:predicted RNase H-like HicB family nuclease